MKLSTTLATFLTVAGLAASSRAASVSSAGYTNDFSTQPVAGDWSFLSVAGASGDITGATSLDAAVETLSAAGITNRVDSDAGNPPAANGNAVWSATGFYLQTRPANNKFTALIARLVNDTGGNLNSCSVGYTFTQAVPAPEEVNGHRVYFSLTGAASTWTNIAALASASPGSLSAALNVTWSNGATLYLLWADDNSSADPDIGNQIDNFFVTVPPAPPPPVQVFAADRTLLATASNITAALALATNHCTVRVAPGIYSAVSSGEVFPLRITNAITLEAATAATPSNATIQGDGQHTILLIATPGVTVRGLRLTGGKGSEGIYRKDGGGICIFVHADAAGGVWIENCLVENNQAGYDVTYDGSGAGIYCGGTWCTCFEICITNCVVRANFTYGNGAGIYCGLLSRVVIANTRIEDNAADDRGGGVCVDSYALTLLKDGTRVERNQARGDTRYERPNWGGKGGGVFYDASAVCEIRDSSIVGNTARYYGGGLFTMSSLSAADSQEDGACGSGPNVPPRFFNTPTLYNWVTRSLVASNRAEWSGGGAFLREQAYLAFDRTTFFWNDAKEDGGGVFLEGGAVLGAMADFAPGCLLEGNQSAGQGGGVFLGMGSVGLFNGTWLLGNSSLDNGGGVQADPMAWLSLTNCLISYNNSARAYGGGFALASGAAMDMQRCSVVGNFAPWGQSGLHLDTGASAAITNSILWRNAGGSIAASGAEVKTGYSLNEDLASAGGTLLNGSPGYVGWGTNALIHVSQGATGLGQGTLSQPYASLRYALTNGFSLRLAATSPCRNAASDGGFIGADTGLGGAAGRTNATLQLFPGGYDIRGRNIAFAFGLQGGGSANTFITNAVFGYIENAFVRDLAITGERWFGGMTVRANVQFGEATVTGNQALADGGGIYVAHGQCLLANSLVSLNTSSGRGGGLFLEPKTGLSVLTSRILANQAGQGGGIYSSADTNRILANSLIADNRSQTEGGGVWLDIPTTSLIDCSQISQNSAALGAGICLYGRLTLTNSWLLSNRAERPPYVAGALFIQTPAVADILYSCIASNYAADTSGGILCLSTARVSHCLFQTNSSAFGAALQVQWPATVYCESSRFVANYAWYDGGAVRCWVSTDPQFVDCEFLENRATSGGAGICVWGSRPAFERCRFARNQADGRGGGFYLAGSAARFARCTFDGNTSLNEGGAAFALAADSATFQYCTIASSVAGTSGGAFFVTETAHPFMQAVTFTDNRAAANGGAVACAMQSSPRFQDVTMARNTAVLGGGVFADGTTSLFFERCELSGNRAESASVSADGGAACFTSNAVARFACSRIVNNNATDDGGGFSAAGQASIGLTNTFLALNHAVNSGGGAHFTSRSAGSFQNCTVVSNAVDISNGGGIYVEANCSLNADSAIIHRNLPDGVAPQHGNAVVNFSCVQEPWPGTANITGDPLLDPVTLLLLDGSPCIDAGNPSALLTDASTPPGKGTLRNDMGASGGPRNCCAPPVTPQWLITSVGTWQFWDRGQTPPGNWRETSYNDADWSSGFAKFGAGGDGEVTAVHLGTNAEQRFISTYFRRAFFVANAASVASLEARLICDDGAVLYLNGVEASRYNLPAGNVVFGTLASSAVSGADENRWVSLPLSAGLLVEGWNVLAVEIHQAAPNSGDLGFDLQLASTVSWTVVPPPRTVYVNDDSTAGDVFTSAVGDDTHPGTVPQLPLRHLATVFQRFTLEPGDTVYLDTGLYAESIVIGSSNRGFSVIGAGAERSLIDGGRTAPCLVLDQVQGVTVKNLCLQHGKGEPKIHPTLTHGGALLTVRSDVLLDGVALRDSTANYGGGAFFHQSDVAVRDSVASGNWATNDGGGLYLDWSTEAGTGILVTNCLFTNNLASLGGGVQAVSGWIVGCQMIGNQAGSGGGCSLEWGADISNSQIIANSAQDAGGMRMVNGATASSCTFSGNLATNLGGGVFVSGGGSRAVACTLSNNQAGSSGGGAFVTDSGTLTDCLVVTNRAHDAGGVWVQVSALVTNCVIGGNLATNNGGGAFVHYNATLTDCLVLTNRAHDAGGVLVQTSARATNCVIGGNVAANNGGGAFVHYFATLTDCLVVSNRANTAGGVWAQVYARATNCVIGGNVAANNGGGAFVHYFATLTDCLVVSNRAHDAGGVWVQVSARATNCIIGGNLATNHGGGVFVTGGDCLAVDCVLTNNQAGNRGGGAFLQSSGILSDCPVVANRAHDAGGVWGELSGKATNCTIGGNLATNNGGGVFLTGGGSSAVGCRVVANQANNRGGGGYVQRGADVSSSLISSNNAYEGGGLRLETGGLVRNSLLNGNSASGGGGGLHLLSGSVENCTLAANSASSAGGLYFDSGGVTNTIVYFNQAPSGPNWVNVSANGFYARCCTTPAVSGSGNITADPRFVNWTADDFQLATDSPCIDTGTIFPWMTNATDLAGNPRIIGISVDMGAYESFLPGTDTDGDGLPDWWEWKYAHSQTAMAPGADNDGDGASNADEFVAGTDPTHPQDVFKIQAIHLEPTGGKAVIAWDTVPGRIYTVVTANEVAGPWTNEVAEFSASTAYRHSFTNSTGRGPSSFLRVGVRPPP